MGFAGDRKAGLGKAGVERAELAWADRAVGRHARRAATMLSRLPAEKDPRAAVGQLESGYAGRSRAAAAGVWRSPRCSCAADAQPYFAGEGTGSALGSAARMGAGRLPDVSVVAVYLRRSGVHAGAAILRETAS